MNDRVSKILLGVLMIIIAVFLLFQGLEFSITPVAVISAGAVLLLLFWTKRKSWSLVLGAYLTLFGISSLIEPMLPSQLSRVMFVAVLYFAPSAIFLTLYLMKNKKNLLIPSMLFAWLGVFAVLDKISVTHVYINSLGLLLVCAGGALLSSYFIGRAHIGRSVYRLGIMLSVAGLLIGTGIITQLAMLVCVLIGIAGFFVIITAIKKRH